MGDVEEVWFERRGGIGLGAVTGGGERRLVVVDEQGASLRVPRGRVLHTLAGRLPAGPPQALAGRLREQLAAQEGPPPLDADLLWSSLDDQRGYTLAELAELAFGARDDRSVLALARSISDQESGGKLRASFRLAQGRVYRVDAHSRTLLLEREERQRAEQELHARFLAWYRGWRAAGAGPPPDAAPELLELLGGLRAYALEGTNATHARTARRLAASLEVADPDELLADLIAAGALPRHVNELPFRRGLTRDFPAAAEEEAAALLGSSPGVGEDLTALPTITIDDAGTEEVDDALSAWEQDGVPHLAVHIALVADRIAPGGALDREARRRATSIYFPGERWPMLPPRLGPRLGLEVGEERAALSLVCPIGADGLPGPGRFVRARVRVDHCLTYDGPPPPLAAEVLARLLPVAESLRAARAAAGASLVSLPPLKITLDAAGEPLARLVPTETSSNLVVSELMVLYNARLAETLAGAGRHALFRVQREPAAPPPPDPGSPLFPLEARRGMLPTQTSVQPGPHRPMGLVAYVQGTSPLRRLGDLLAQRELLALLDGAPPTFEAAELEALRQEIYRRERQARGLEEERRRYWICRWLELRGATPHAAVISRVGARPMVYLPALDRELPLADQPPPPPVGTRVQVRVLRVALRQRDVLLALA